MSLAHLGACTDGHGLAIAHTSLQHALEVAGAWQPLRALADGGGATSPPPLPPLLPASLLQLADLATALQAACFDPACQAEKDALLIASIALPLLALVAGIAYLLRPPPKARLDAGTLIKDNSTGVGAASLPVMVPAVGCQPVGR